VVEAVKYPPLGRRGFFMRGILTDCGEVSTADGIVRENQETMVVVQVETAEALADVENIVQVAGIDAIMIGPQDLSIALGVPGQVMHERMKDAFRRVAEACRPSPVALGIHLDDPALLAQFRTDGFLFLDYSTDLGLLMKALRQGLGVAKGSP
jgi:4-hydroxy-2-oxoheptanedioate aldolase